MFMATKKCVASRVTDQLATRVASGCFSQLPSNRHVRFGPTRRHSRDLRSHFVIRARRGRFFLFDFLANEREPTGKTFTTPLTSPNPNIYVKFIFPWSSPFKVPIIRPGLPRSYQGTGCRRLRVRWRQKKSMQMAENYGSPSGPCSIVQAHPPCAIALSTSFQDRVLVLCNVLRETLFRKSDLWTPVKKTLIKRI